MLPLDFSTRVLVYSKHVACHVFDAVGTAAVWVGGDRTRSIRTIFRPVSRLITPLTPPRKIAAVGAPGGFLPFQSSWQSVANAVLF